MSIAAQAYDLYGGIGDLAEIVKSLRVRGQIPRKFGTELLNSCVDMMVSVDAANCGKCANQFECKGAEVVQEMIAKVRAFSDIEPEREFDPERVYHNVSDSVDEIFARSSLAQMCRS